MVIAHETTFTAQQSGMTGHARGVPWRLIGASRVHHPPMTIPQPPTPVPPVPNPIPPVPEPIPNPEPLPSPDPEPRPEMRAEAGQRDLDPGSEVRWAGESPAEAEFERRSGEMPGDDRGRAGAEAGARPIEDPVDGPVLADLPEPTEPPD